MGEIDSTGTPSAGLFAREYGSVYSFPVERQPRGLSENSPSSGGQILRSEFWNMLKISSSEITLLIQGIIILGSLFFILYIGMTGGITDGSDRFDFINGVMNELNELDEILDLNAISNTITDGHVSATPGVWL
jgi:hypothetical protein